MKRLGCDFFSCESPDLVTRLYYKLLKSSSAAPGSCILLTAKNCCDAVSPQMWNLLDLAIVVSSAVSRSHVCNFAFPKPFKTLSRIHIGFFQTPHVVKLRTSF